MSECGDSAFIRMICLLWLRKLLRIAKQDDVLCRTVDKFQGQESPVVIYSLTSSSVEEAPRGLSFLFNKNRLNVATSRAKCMAILVGSDALAETDCKTPGEMSLANGLLSFLELADSFN